MAVARRSHTLRIALRSVQFTLAALSSVGVFAAGLLRRPDCGVGRVEQALGLAMLHFCEQMGATFIKIGQIASTRADLLPHGIVDALAKLRDQVRPFPMASVREIVEQDLGGRLEDHFPIFEPEPVAAASVAQVHRGELPDGRIVAVKVRRPDIADKAALDRSILLFVARSLERIVPSLRLVALEEAMRQFVDAVEEQLHLTIEARNNARFHADFADDPGVVFPALHPDLCSDRVLTMAFVDGVHERDLEGSGIDIVEVVKTGMRVVCRMIFSNGFVHSDLHPGNMRFLPPGRVALFDLGLVGRLLDEDRLETARMLFAFATGDGATVAKVLYDSSPHTATRDYAAYEREVQEFVSGLFGRGMSNVQITLEIGRLFDILRRHKVQARGHMTMVNLALMTAEGLGKRLAPDLALTDAALPYLAEALGVRAPPAAAAGAPPAAEAQASPVAKRPGLA